MSDKIEKLYDELSKMTVLEVSGLIKRLEEGWGVSAAAAVPMAMPMPGGGGGCRGRGRGEDRVRRHPDWRSARRRST